MSVNLRRLGRRSFKRVGAMRSFLAAIRNPFRKLGRVLSPRIGGWTAMFYFGRLTRTLCLVATTRQEYHRSIA